MYIQALVIVVLLGKFMKRVFFGQLRAAEVEVLFFSRLHNITIVISHFGVAFNR